MGKPGDRHKWVGKLTTTKIAGVRSGNHSNPHVLKAAEGGNEPWGLAKRAGGGRCGEVEGEASRSRLDRPGRKMGGACEERKNGGKLDLHLKKGALHKELGVAQGEKIPAKKLEKAAHSSDPLLKKRAVFAENAKKWSHGK